MNRLKEVWVEFKGVKNTDIGAKMISMPVRYMPVQRGKAISVAGRPGDLWYTDNTDDSVEISMEFAVPDESCRLAVNAWLRGTGLLRFSDEPNMAYEARVSRGYKRQSISPRLMGQKYTVVFSCHPHRLLYPEAEAFTITTLYEQFKNPGTAPSRPRVKITGNGDFSVTIGLETLCFSDITGGGIIVDSHLMDAFTYDGAALANDHFDGMPWQIKPGYNTVSWLFEAGSSVESIEILPRWRYV